MSANKGNGTPNKGGDAPDGKKPMTRFGTYESQARLLAALVASLEEKQGGKPFTFDSKSESAPNIPSCHHSFLSTPFCSPFPPTPTPTRRTTSAPP